MCLQKAISVYMNYEVILSSAFKRWLRELRDKHARARVAVRIDRLQEGNFGDHQSVGQGVSEMRVHAGKGYRIYYTIRTNTLVVLLCGGDKSSQPRDIERARQLAREL